MVDLTVVLVGFVLAITSGSCKGRWIVFSSELGSERVLLLGNCETSFELGDEPDSCELTDKVDVDGNFLLICTSAIPVKRYIVIKKNQIKRKHY